MTVLPPALETRWTFRRVTPAAVPLVTILLGIVAGASAEATSGRIVGMLAGSFGLVAAAAVASSGHRLGWLSPTRVFLGGAALYIVPALATMLAVGGLSGGRDVDFTTLREGAGLSVAAFGWGTVGIGVAGLFRVRRSSWPQVAAWFRVPLLVAAALSWVAGAAAVATFVFLVAGFGNLLGASYGERYQAMAGYGALILGAQVVTLATLAGFASATVTDRRRLAWAFVIFGIGFHGAWTLLVGARTGFVQLVLGLVALWQCLGGRVAGWKVAVVGLAVFVGGLTIGATRAGIRSPLDLDTSQLLVLANPANSEFGATLPTIGEVVAAVPSQEPLRLGATYLAAFGVVVPLAMWPNRPLGAAEWYVRRFYPEVADGGGGFAFSPVAEAYLNFGRAGVVVVFVFVGLVVGALDGYLRAPRSALMAITYSVSVYSLLIFSRLDAATALKSHLILPFGQLGLLFGVAWLIRLAGAAPARPTL